MLNDLYYFFNILALVNYSKKQQLMFLFIRYLVIALLFKFSISQTNSPGKVTGRLLSYPATPLMNKVVSLASDSLVVRMTRTNEKGEFTFSKVPKGNYRILIVLTGYEKYTTGFFKLTDTKPSREFGEIELQASKN
jgi:hypothetical protein